MPPTDQHAPRAGNALTRFWKYSAPFRERFGLVQGLQAARSFRLVDYRDATDPAVPVRVPGWPNPLWLRPGTTDPWVYRQLVLGGELNVPMAPPRRIIDGGANIGLASLHFTYRWPAAEIVAVELQGGNVETLRRNVAATPKVRVFHGALWGEAGEVGVDSADFGEVGFRVDSSAQRSRVRAWGVSDLMDELGWDRLDLLKLDIEGAEREVLADAPRWLPRVDRVLIELHERFAPGCEAIFAKTFPDAEWSVSVHDEYHLAQRRGGP